MKTLSTLLLAGLALGANKPSSAQNASGGWRYLVAPYLMFPNIKGETGIGELPSVPVDADPGDVFENLQLGAMLYAEMQNDTWTFSSDVLYMALEQDIDERVLITGGEVGISQIGWELAAMRRFTSWLELGVGVTYNRIEADVDINLQLGTLSTGTTEDWIDPSIVGRATFPINDHWYFQTRANVGGFGLGSDFMWQLAAEVGYRSSERWSFTFGYRVMDFDYDHGSDENRFVYDMQTFGPQIKAGYSF
jgi:hypothetical protein